MALNFENLNSFQEWSVEKSCTVATTNIITSTGHGLVANDIVRFFSGVSMPSPLKQETDYYVLYIDANTFKVSETPGGAEIDITTTGSGVYFNRNVEPIVAGTTISNQTRAGEGLLVNVERNTFNLADVSDVKFLVVSGSFAAGDEIQTSDGGEFYIYGTATTTTEESILVDGVNDADSTSDLMGAISDSVKTIYHSNHSVIGTMKCIKIDNEWMMTMFAADGSNSKNFTAATNDKITCNNHGLADGSVVRVSSTGTLPAPLSASTSYYVIHLTANTFYLSTTLGGTRVNITSTGSGTHTFTLQDELYVQRGLFGTTAASHSDNTSIYVLDTDLYAAICAEDASEGWGLCDCSSGKLVISANIFLGRPDQTASSLLVSSMENIVLSGALYRCGNETYPTISQHGLGWVESGTENYQGLFTMGSILNVGGIYHYLNCEANDFRTTVYIEDGFSSKFKTFGGGAMIGCDFSSGNIYDYIGFFNTAALKFYDNKINNQRMTFGSIYLDMDAIEINYKVLQESVYFLSGGGDATIRNVSHKEPAYDNGKFAFASSGTKTFIDCYLNSHLAQFLANVVSSDKKTITVNCQKRDGTAVEGAQVAIRYLGGTTYSTDTTDSNGQASIEMQFRYQANASDSETRPVEIFITKSGYKSLYFYTWGLELLYYCNFGIYNNV